MEPTRTGPWLWVSRSPPAACMPAEFAARRDYNGAILSRVMPGLGPGIHVFLSSSTKDVDGRDISAFTRVFRRAKPGHDVRADASGPVA